MKTHRATLAFLASMLLLAFCGCHSARVEATVTNHTGGAIELLEVDYPSASFGADSLASAAEFHYRFQIRLSGPVKVQYTESATHALRQATGPILSEKEQGQIYIDLLPGGKVDFHTELAPQH